MKGVETTEEQHHSENQHKRPLDKRKFDESNDHGCSLPAKVRWRSKYKTGRTNRISTADVSMPPTTTRAKGCWDWAPIPVATAAGNNPIAAASVVIRTGRMRTAAFFKIAVLRSNPRARYSGMRERSTSAP